jgi:hypothetical protein
MAEYREIQGAAVQSLASSTGTIEGQIWYDTANNAFKLQSVTTSGTWASAPAFPVASRGGYGFGTPSAGLTAGGIVGTVINTSYEWNGSAWGTGGNLTASGFIGGGGGTQTAAVYSGFGTGAPPAPSTTNDYDGTSWAAGNPLNTNRYYGKGGGPEVWNGSTWTAVNNFLISNEGSGSGDGQTDNSSSAVSLGTSNPETGNVYVWDGTCWASDTAMSNGRGSAYQLGGNPSALTYNYCKEWTGRRNTNITTT